MTGDAYSMASKALHESGRLFFGATGNTPVASVTPFPYPDIMLPPWVVLVGGAHSECGAQETMSGHPMELAANFTQKLPSNTTTDESWWTAGTSFAAPAMAGTFGQALLGLRGSLGTGPHAGALWRGEPTPAGPLADGELSNEDLRAAFALHARYFATTDYEPTAAMCLTAAQVGGVPGPVGPAPWQDQGWGYAGPAEAQAVVQWLAGNGDEPPAKPAAAEAWMAQVQAARAVVKG
ncbi:MAG TPA: hypothetical protein VM327_10055 [Candidatus Thermoplasmatota archaeon]|nr:hypothetical protein [Candidatus Thermoplasmatota archaeon]